MAFVFLQEVDGDPDERSTNTYDAVKEALNIDADKPAGLIVHTAGFTGDGVFRIFDVWESEEHFTRFRDERLLPTLEKIMAGGGGGRPSMREFTYELHDLVTA